MDSSTDLGNFQPSIISTYYPQDNSILSQYSNGNNEPNYQPFPQSYSGQGYTNPASAYQDTTHFSNQYFPMSMTPMTTPRQTFQFPIQTTNSRNQNRPTHINFKNFFIDHTMIF